MFVGFIPGFALVDAASENIRTHQMNMLLDQRLRKFRHKNPCATKSKEC